MNKAVLTAGGRGTRLAPLTDRIPKPLMPFLDTTVLEQTLCLLSQHGITEAVVTVQYRAEQICAKLGDCCCGIRIRYCHEHTPLGTAGALPTIRKLLDLKPNENFFVMSGDCICDFDLSDAIKAHEESRAEATVLTTSCDNPLEYGIVVSDSNGRIRAIHEKPPWSQVVGDRINAGIYLLNESVIRYVTATPFDFSHDLFPALLQDGCLLREYKADGYWCDIGSVDSYKTCCTDALRGKIRFVKGHNGHNGHNGLDEAALALQNVRCIPPYYVSKSASVGDGTTIGPNTIVSHGCAIGKNCCLTDCILLPNSTIGDGCVLSDVLVCDGASAPHGISLKKKIVSAESVLSSKERTENTSLFGNTPDGSFLGLLEKVDIAVLSDAALALANAVEKGEKAAVMYADSATAPHAQTLANLLAAKGIGVIDCGQGFEKLARFLPAFLQLDCMIYLYPLNKNVYVKIFNRNGSFPSHAFERKTKNRSHSTNPPPEKAVTVLQNAESVYYNALLDSLTAFGNSNLKNFSLAFCGKPTEEILLLQKAIRSLGGAFSVLDTSSFANDRSPLTLLSESDGSYTLRQGQTLLDRYHIEASLLQSLSCENAPALVLPYLSPNVYQRLTNGASVTRYPYHTAKRFRFSEKALDTRRYPDDELFSIAFLLSVLCAEKRFLSDLADRLPPFGYRVREFSVENNREKLRILSYFSQRSPQFAPTDRYEGIPLDTKDGQITLVPQDSLSFRVYAEALSTEAAEALCDEAIRELSSLTEHSDDRTFSSENDRNALF